MNIDKVCFQLGKLSSGVRELNAMFPGSLSTIENDEMLYNVLTDGLKKILPEELFYNLVVKELVVQKCENCSRCEKEAETFDDKFKNA